MNHPEEALASYVDGVATLQERASVEAHLAFCPRCREDVERARAAREAVASLPEIPALEGTAAAVLAAAAGLGLEPRPAPAATRAPDSAGTAAPAATPAPDSAGTAAPAATPAPDSAGTAAPAATPAPDSAGTAAPAATPPPRPTPARRPIRPRAQAPRLAHRPDAAPTAPTRPEPSSAEPEPEPEPEAEPSGPAAPSTPERPALEPSPAAAVEPAPPAAPEHSPAQPVAPEPSAAETVAEPEALAPRRPAPHVPSRPTPAYRRERWVRRVWMVGAGATVLVLFGLLGLFLKSTSGPTFGGAGAGTAAQPAPREAAGKGAGAGGALVHDQKDYGSASFASFARQLATEATRSGPAPQGSSSAAGGAADIASPTTPRDQALACLQRGTGLVEGTTPFYVEQATYGGEPVYIGAFVAPASGGGRSLLVLAVTVDGCQARQVVRQAL